MVEEFIAKGYGMPYFVMANDTAHVELLTMFFVLKYNEELEDDKKS